MVRSAHPIVLGLAADLLFTSRIRAAAQAAGVQAILCRKPDELVAAALENAPHRIFIDLDARTHDPVQVISSLKSDERTRSIDLVAFVSHVRADVIANARKAGADTVLARSAFVQQLPALVRLPQ
jgi:DNA-binding NarL/FixJ family response regulator